jgi:tetratricopeptide (TPR) repeat protein
MQHPEPFASALKEGRTRQVMDAPASTPQAFLARGLARAQEGSHEAARKDFEAATSELGDICVVECLYLDRRFGLRPLEEVVRDLRDIEQRSDPLSRVRARALHERGYAQGKRRQHRSSLELLLRARDIYLQLGEALPAAQVRDTLGTLYRSLGNFPEALTQFALSIVSKTTAGDRYGAALTLGNMSLLLIQLERFDEAASCAEENRRISETLDNSVGIVASQTRLGAALIGNRRFEQAAESLNSAMGRLQQDQRLGGSDEMFLRRELARLALATEDLGAAAEHLERARLLLPDRPEPYHLLILDIVQAQLLLARQDSRGLDALEDCAARAIKLQFPAEAVRLLIDVAHHHHAADDLSKARTALNQARDLARWPGCELFLTRIREAFAEIFADSAPVPFTANEPLPGTSRVEQPPRFVKFCELGRGGFGAVYQAYDTSCDEYVALKELHIGDEYDPQERRRIHSSAKTELLATSHVAHKGIARARALDYDPETGDLQVIQDFVDGQSLRSVMDTEPLEPLLFLETAKNLGYALAAVHDLGVVHRDLKPDNILLRASDFDPVIIDFGVAAIRNDIAKKTTLHHGGTTTYMCNEQRRREPPSSKWDMFSLGVTLYEWCTHSLPDELETPEPIRASVVREKMPSALAEVSDLPEDARNLISRLLSLDRNKRPTAAEFAAECKRIIEVERDAAHAALFGAE